MKTLATPLMLYDLESSKNNEGKEACMLIKRWEMTKIKHGENFFSKELIGLFNALQYVMQSAYYDGYLVQLEKRFFD